MKKIGLLINGVVKDKPLLLLCIGIIALVVAYIIYLSFSLHPVENQIAVRYTAYGETNLYRNQWYYLLTFVGLAVLMAIVHIGLLIKLKEREMRSLAMAFGWLTMLLVVILFLYTHSILGNAYFL